MSATHCGDGFCNTVHFCTHCHDDPPRGHTCPTCGARPRQETTPTRVGAVEPRVIPEAGSTPTLPADGAS